MGSQQHIFPHANSSLNKQSNTSLSFPVLISSRGTTGGIPPGPGGSLGFLPLKSDDLFRWWHAPGWQPWRNQSTEWPFVGWEGTFYFNRKVFLVNLILVPRDHKSEPLCVCISVWCSEPKTSFKYLKCFGMFLFIPLRTVQLHCYTREAGKKSRVQPAGVLPNHNNSNFILSIHTSCSEALRILAVIFVRKVRASPNLNTEGFRLSESKELGNY